MKSVLTMPSRNQKKNRNGFDYASQGQLPAQPIYGQAPYGYPMMPVTNNTYPANYNGYLYGYGTGYSHSYGSEGYHEYMRSYDPSYDEYFPDGPTVDDKWRSTYPYVPTAYAFSQDGHSTTQRRRGGGGSVNRDSADPHKASNINNSDMSIQGKRVWTTQWEFALSCLGYSVGIFNICRFPGAAYDNGGGAFLVAYVILLLFIGYPMYFAETMLGQFSSVGPGSFWRRISPVATGIGTAMCTLSLITVIYYHVFLSYCLHYAFSSLWSFQHEELPWKHCSAAWSNESLCHDRFQPNAPCAGTDCSSPGEIHFQSFVLGVESKSQNSFMIYKEPFNATSDVIVDRTYALPFLGQIGTVKWDLAITLGVIYLITMLCLIRGIRSSGRAMYVTATLPYIILSALLIRLVMLEGALTGIGEFFTPQWFKLLEPKTWLAAIQQMFLSLSISWGGLFMLGSHNKFQDRVQITSLLVPVLDFLTSIMASVVIFAVLGQFQLKLGIDNLMDILQRTDSAYFFTFVAVPETLSLVPGARIWTFLFFLLIIVLGIDTTFTLVQTITTALSDAFPSLRKHNMWIVIAISCIGFLISLPCITYSGGIFIMEVLEQYGFFLCVYLIAIVETIFLFWIYGVDRISQDVKFMLNVRLPWIVRFWLCVIPVILIAALVGAAITWTHPTSKAISFSPMNFPFEIHVIGWALTLIVALQIPVAALIIICFYGLKGQMKVVVSPMSTWGPAVDAIKDDWAEYRFRKAFQCKQHPQGWQAYYDNYAMQYPQYVH